MNFQVYKEAVYHRCHDNTYCCVYLENYTCEYCQIKGPSVLIEALGYKKYSKYSKRDFIKILAPKGPIDFIKKTGNTGPLNTLWKDFVLNSINFYVED